MFILEGTIGAGKSTFLTLMKKFYPEVTTALEPVQQWDSGLDSLLTRFMGDPQRWAYTMETFAMICRIKDHCRYQQIAERLLLVERSIYSGHYVFALNGYLQGFMSPQEWHAYMTYFEYLVPQQCALPKGFIYIRVSPEIAYRRICKRRRGSESGISMEYLEQLHARHEDFLVAKRGVYAGLEKVPVLIIDGDHEFEQDKARSYALCKQVVEFMAQQVATHQDHIYQPVAGIPVVQSNSTERVACW